MFYAITEVLMKFCDFPNYLVIIVLMNFNNPFNPFFPPWNRQDPFRPNPLSNWPMGNGLFLPPPLAPYQFPPPPTYSPSFQSQPIPNPYMIHQQNNYFGSNFSFQNQERGIKPVGEKYGTNK